MPHNGMGAFAYPGQNTLVQTYKRPQKSGAPERYHARRGDYSRLGASRRLHSPDVSIQPPPSTGDISAKP
jgi:hypothetical protein